TATCASSGTTSRTSASGSPAWRAHEYSGPHRHHRIRHRARAHRRDARRARRDPGLHDGAGAPALARPRGRGRLLHQPLAHGRAVHARTRATGRVAREGRAVTLTLTRFASTPDGVLGRLGPWCTLEEEALGNRPNVSCIPAGTYLCRRS